MYYEKCERVCRVCVGGGDGEGERRETQTMGELPGGGR